MFANDYTYKQAYEPVDDATDQDTLGDPISNDLWTYGSTYGHSFGLRAAKGIVGTAYQVTLIPCAKGATTILNWMPDPTDRLDRGTLYGSAHYRHDTVLPAGGLTALWYYGHESNSTSALARSAYVAGWTALMAEFRADMGASLPVVYVQLAKHSDATLNTGQHLVAELQRKMETGSGDASAIALHYMVVAFDLALVNDGVGKIHLSQAGQKTLGDRIALATRQHVLGEAVNGTGPRLNGAPTAPAANQVKVDTTSTLATISANADGQFRVFDGGVEMTVASVVKDPADASAALITMTATATGTVTVSYGDVAASGADVTLSNVVKDADGLPLPQFGLQTVV
jgi:hypothetical protein